MKNNELSTLHIRSLLQAIETKQTASIQFDDSPLEANGILLGGDFVENELLICDTFPDIGQELRRSEFPKHFWLRVRTGNHYLRIFVRFKNTSHGLITVKIIETSLSANKRWHNRVDFQSLQGPTARINREFATNLDAKVLNLSPKGAALDIWGKEVHEVVPKGNRLKTTLTFNSHFELNLDCQILNSQFIRRPSCHTRLRVFFDSLDTLSFCQLSHFIDVTANVMAA